MIKVLLAVAILQVYVAFTFGLRGGMNFGAFKCRITNPANINPARLDPDCRCDKVEVILGLGRSWPLGALRVFWGEELALEANAADLTNCVVRPMAFADQETQDSFIAWANSYKFDPEAKMVVELLESPKINSLFYFTLTEIEAALRNHEDGSLLFRGHQFSLQGMPRVY